MHCCMTWNVLFPNRSSGSEYLVSGGPTKTWIIGNSLVTITTSGKLGDGTCKRCALNRTEDDLQDYFNLGQDTGEAPPLFSGCWHSGWAEIRIRRPAGNTGWMMRLQNRPHPLSLTHPSTHGIPESELGLLGMDISPGGNAHEEGYTIDSQEGVVVGRKGQDQEDLFLSREVGSFTDISFMSQAPSSVVDASMQHGNSRTTDHGSSPVKIAGVEGGVPTTEAGGEGERILVSEEDGGALYSSILKEVVGEEVGIVVEGVLGPSLSGSQGDEGGKTITNEGDMHSEPIADGKKTATVSASGFDSKSYPASEGDKVIITEEKKSSSVRSTPQGSARVVSSIPPHVKRPTNSQSWSEDGVTTSPVPIAPHASSYSFTVEHLPPLLSYDGGEELSTSPSLLAGGKVMSEEEQV